MTAMTMGGFQFSSEEAAEFDALRHRLLVPNIPVFNLLERAKALGISHTALVSLLASEEGEVFLRAVAETAHMRDRLEH